jgi:uncharacterized protein YcgI (DUF1989 family)
MMASSVLPARHGTAVALAAGDRLQIINRDGGQVVDRWALALAPSPARAGDSVTFEAEIDVLVVVSACPMDLNPINATMGDIGLRTLPRNPS